MFRNSHNSKGLSTNAGRWRTVSMALVLALIIGSAGQTPLAQAAPARVPVKVYMDIVSPKTTVCAGKTVIYEARVYTPPTTIVGIKVDRYALSGIKVEASSQDKNVGDFTGTKKGFVTRNTTALQPLDDFETTPHSAYFTFKAKKAGKTTLYFEGVAHGQYVSFDVPVKVINCKYKVKIVSKWSAGMTIVATSSDGVMTADENGYFTGSANVNWVTSILCGIKSPIAPSKADLTGTINESDQLVVKITFQPTSSSGGGNCGAAGVSTSNFLTPAPLTIRVATTGAVSTRQAQVVTAKNGSFTGTANVYVIPVDGTK